MQKEKPTLKHIFQGSTEGKILYHLPSKGWGVSGPIKDDVSEQPLENALAHLLELSCRGRLLSLSIIDDDTGRAQQYVLQLGAVVTSAGPTEKPQPIKYSLE